jgi:H+-translocating NAD(P) transhydrogenase subunit beta
MTPELIDFGYIVAAALFILGLKLLSSQATARRGNAVSASGMLIAVVLTLFTHGLEYQWIIVGIVLGSALGLVLALRVQMTGMPEMVALLNGFGGLASLLVAWAEYDFRPERMTPAVAAPAMLAVLIGGVTFSGSLIAYLKLSEKLSGKPVLFRGQVIVNAVLLILALVAGTFFTLAPAASYPAFLLVIVLGLLLGVLLVIPIGGADMPGVISLLNSYSGLAACAAGFIIGNTVLIVSGALVGASGIILTNIMCKAMNRSLPNVLFGGVGAGPGGAGESLTGEPKPISAGDTYYLLEAARSVVIAPGYGMAVAQAQHVVKELAEILERNGTEVKFAIHAVAGRMPGHMNVLLAEADVPYEQLAETEDVNPLMPSVDIALVIGANDVVNPAAREDKGSPLYGMPIINVDQARTVIVMKRSMKAGFAGVDNPLFVAPNVRMLFGDAKQTLQSIVSEFKSA